MFDYHQRSHRALLRVVEHLKSIDQTTHQDQLGGVVIQREFLEDFETQPDMLGFQPHIRTEQLEDPADVLWIYNRIVADSRLATSDIASA